MNELNYSNKHFVSGTYHGSLTCSATKIATAMAATLNFDIESGKVTGQIEDQSGEGEASGTFSKTAPYDFKIKKGDMTFNGFRQEGDLIGRWKSTSGGQGVFQLKVKTSIAEAKPATAEQEMTSEETIAQLVGMGFEEEKVRKVVVEQGLGLTAATEALVSGGGEARSDVPTKEVMVQIFDMVGDEFFQEVDTKGAAPTQLTPHMEGILIPIATAMGFENEATAAALREHAKEVLPAMFEDFKARKG